MAEKKPAKPISKSDSAVKTVDKVKKISSSEAYHIKKKARESRSYGGGRTAAGKAADRKKGHKDRMAKLPKIGG